MPVGRESGRAEDGWTDFLLLGTLGRYGIKSDARAVLRMNSGITFDAMPNAARVTAYDAKNATTSVSE